MSGSPSHHVFIGPVLWAPAITPPPFWASVPDNRPLVYVTMGSSGQVNVLPRVLEGLAALQATVVVSTAGRYPMSRLPKNVLAGGGDVMARRADVVVQRRGEHGVPGAGRRASRSSAFRTTSTSTSR